jgi:hypothetical protein
MHLCRHKIRAGELCIQIVIGLDTLIYNCIITRNNDLYEIMQAGSASISKAGLSQLVSYNATTELEQELANSVPIAESEAIKKAAELVSMCMFMCECVCIP